MSTELFIKLLSSFCLLFLGIMAKFSANDGWQPVKKYWLYFVLVGLLSLAYIVFKYFLS